MTQPTPEATSENEERLKQRLERGADVELKVHKRFSTDAEIDASQPVVISIPQTKDVLADNLDLNLTLRVSHTKSLDFAILIFINTPDATADTPVDAPGFVGSMAFFGHPEHHEFTGSGVRLPISKEFARTSKPDDLTATIVPVPYPGRTVTPDKLRVTAAIEEVSTKVTRK